MDNLANRVAFNIQLVALGILSLIVAPLLALLTTPYYTSNPGARLLLSIMFAIVGMRCLLTKQTPLNRHFRRAQVVMGTTVGVIVAILLVMPFTTDQRIIVQAGAATAALGAGLLLAERALRGGARSINTRRGHFVIFSLSTARAWLWHIRTNSTHVLMIQVMIIFRLLRFFIPVNLRKELFLHLVQFMSNCSRIKALRIVDNIDINTIN